MKEILITFTIIIMLIGASIHFGDIHFRKSSTDVLFMLFDQLLEATPDTKSEYFENEESSNANIESYISEKFSSIATERMMKNLYTNDYIMSSINFAEKTNSKVMFDSIEIINSRDSDEGEYYNFKGTTKVISQDTNDASINM